LLINEQFKTYLKELTIKSFTGKEVTTDVSSLVNKEFIDDIESSFKTEIIDVINIDMILILLVILGLTLLTMLLSFSLYYPFLYLGIPVTIMGLVLLFLKSNQNTLIELLSVTLGIKSDLIDQLISINNEGILLLIIGLVLIILFIIIKVNLNKKDSLDQTRRINIEDINI